MDEGGKWKHQLWADLRSGRRIRLQFQGVGAHPWIPERRDGLAGRIYNRLVADDCFSGRQFLAGVQRRLNALNSGGGYSAYQSVFGSNPVDLYGCGDGKDGDLLFAQDTWLSR